MSEMLGKDLVYLCPFSCLTYCCISFECRVYLHSFVFDFCVVLKLVSISVFLRGLHTTAGLCFNEVGLLKIVISATEWLKFESLRKYYMTCRSSEMKNPF